MSILDILGKRMVFCDGGMGTLLQERGLKAGELPEIWNITKPEIIMDIHSAYLEAGCDIIFSNTFGVNNLKFNKEPYTAAVLAYAGVKNANAVCEKYSINGRKCYTALNIGPTGKLLKPMGDLAFKECYEVFRELVIEGTKAGADLVLIETMSDTFEIKAAILAAKENCNLPVFATMIFDEKGELLTGGNVAAAVTLLEGLGVDALGINCGLGPEQMKGIFREIKKHTSIPIIVNPNAGLPRSVNGQTVFDVNPEDFALAMKEIVTEGAWVVGGCCGTTPAHIQAMIDCTKNIVPIPIEKKNKTVVSSYSKAVEICDDPVIIGERINPTGKKKFKEALKKRDFDYILGEGIKQQESGAHILDVNVGLPEINEPEMMEEVIFEIQSIIDLPLQIDTSDPAAMESGLRSYNGKALINSVNGKEESMRAIFPLVKKYGGVVIGLTLDEGGIPDTAQGRFDIAEKIVKTAGEYGIEKKDIIIDVLTLTVSSEKDGAKITLEALAMVREKLGVNTILGVSNISFGLPQREIINATFFGMALLKGLTAAIINPGAEGMMRAYHSYRALMGYDENCNAYIESYNKLTEKPQVTEAEQISLFQMIERGLRDSAYDGAKSLLISKKPMEIIAEDLIPALDKVGKGFGMKTVFLPQLLMCAEAAKAAFLAVSEEMEKTGATQEKKHKIVLATVKGDIHDIGKNIVKVLLESYGFDVIDLGKDVEPNHILDVVKENNVQLVGLSALMTTTVTSMEKTIKLLKKYAPTCKITVGGAVLTQEYADMIGADNYGRDAMAAVYYAQQVFGEASFNNDVL